jgi:hypothetical protein
MQLHEISMTRAFAPWLLTTIFIVTAAVIPAWAEELHFKEPAEDWPSDYTGFIEKLSETIKRTYPPSNP